MRTSDEDYGALLKSLKKRPYDYFKDFYGDTAVEGARAATVCGLDFFGADHVVFASDCPFDKEKGPGYIRDTIKVLNSLPLSDVEDVYKRQTSGLSKSASDDGCEITEELTSSRIVSSMRPLNSDCIAIAA